MLIFESLKKVNILETASTSDIFFSKVQTDKKTSRMSFYRSVGSEDNSGYDKLGLKEINQNLYFFHNSQLWAKCKGRLGYKLRIQDRTVLGSEPL